MRPDPQETELDERPPVGGTWRRLYGLLVFELTALTLVFYVLTRWAQ